MPTRTPTNSRVLNSAITRLKNKLIKERERHDALLNEVKKIAKLEKLAHAQNDQQNIAKVKNRIASL